MAKYTIELRNVIKISPDIGLNEYPIFDENYRQLLNQKIINHFYFKEIGMESIPVFKHYMSAKMSEIMPYYNKLYESKLLDFNPLYNVSLSQNTERTVKGNATNDITGRFDNTNTGSTSNKEKLKSVSSDTPQALLQSDDIFENETFASAAKLDDNSIDVINENSGTGTNSANTISTNNLTDEYLRTVTGANGNKTPSEMLMEYRQTFLNIDMRIIDDLKELFMIIY